MKVSVIIPSLNPDQKLVDVVDAVINEGFDDIIIVNDGSDKDHLWPFETIAKHKEVTILTHEVNKGKGRGLKTAFEYCLENRKGIDGVVTADGDNQHRACDIMKCCEAMVASEDKVILGVRDFNGPNVPKRSRFGNHFTSFVFKALCGLKISDTQTGLRAIPYSALEAMIATSGERFEYETNMLLALKDYNLGYEEVVIETVYIEENESSHFNPVKDSIKIYKVIFKHVFKGTGFKYVLGAIASWIIDQGLFTLLNCVLTLADAPRQAISKATARVLSSIFNYTVNSKLVFKSDEKKSKTVVRYYILWAVQLLCSYGLLYLTTSVLTLNKGLQTVASMIIDLLLFLISYQVQKRWVFKKH